MERELIIAPSLLASDFAHFGDEARRAMVAGADWLHLDVMDGHFVPNISFGPEVVRTMRREVPDATLDVHLMIDQPNRYAEEFIESGADILTVHLEAPHDVRKTLREIRDRGCRAGLAINPPTLLENALPLLEEADLFLCMTVNPGFGGQSFIPEVMDKVKEARAFIKKNRLNVDIQVDGGIGIETGATSIRAGANVLVAGTSLFKAEDMGGAIRDMRSQARKALAGG